MLDWGIILTALISALLGGGFVSIYLAKSQRAINKASATKTEVDGLRGIIEEYRTERTGDRKELYDLECEMLRVRQESDRKSLDNQTRIMALEEALLAKDREIALLQSKVAALEAQLEALEQTPITKRNGKKPGTGPLPEPV